MMRLPLHLTELMNAPGVKTDIVPDNPKKIPDSLSSSSHHSCKSAPPRSKSDPTPSKRRTSSRRRRHRLPKDSVGRTIPPLCRWKASPETPNSLNKPPVCLRRTSSLDDLSATNPFSSCSCDVMSSSPLKIPVRRLSPRRETLEILTQALDDVEVDDLAGEKEFHCDELSVAPSVITIKSMETV